MSTIVKHETVLTRETKSPQREPWLFVTPPGEELPGTQVLLTDCKWKELGRPDTITVAVWAGDGLQHERATRESV